MNFFENPFWPLTLFGGIISVLIFILFLFSKPFMSHDCKNNQRILSSEYRGIVTKKYEDRRNHYSPTFSVDNEGKTHNVDYLRNPFYDQIKLGDSLVKKKGELF